MKWDFAALAGIVTGIMGALGYFAGMAIANFRCSRCACAIAPGVGVSEETDTV